MSKLQLIRAAGARVLRAAGDSRFYQNIGRKGLAMLKRIWLRTRQGAKVGFRSLLKAVPRIRQYVANATAGGGRRHMLPSVNNKGLLQVKTRAHAARSTPCSMTPGAGTDPCPCTMSVPNEQVCEYCVAAFHNAAVHHAQAQAHAPGQHSPSCPHAQNHPVAAATSTSRTRRRTASATRRKRSDPYAWLGLSKV